MKCSEGADLIILDCKHWVCLPCPPLTPSCVSRSHKAHHLMLFSGDATSLVFVVRRLYTGHAETVRVDVRHGAATANAEGGRGAGPGAWGQAQLGGDVREPVLDGLSVETSLFSLACLIAGSRPRSTYPRKLLFFLLCVLSTLSCSRSRRTAEAAKACFAR